MFEIHVLNKRNNSFEPNQKMKADGPISTSKVKEMDTKLAIFSNNRFPKESIFVHISSLYSNQFGMKTYNV